MLTCSLINELKFLKKKLLSFKYALFFIVENGVIYCFFHQQDTLSRKEISQEGSETSVGAQFSPEFNLNETTFTELPSRRKDPKKKKMSLLAKHKNLTELCYNIKVKEEQTLDVITSLVDEALSRKKLEAESEGLVERNTETTHVKQTESTTKDYVFKGVLPLPMQPTKYPASGRVGATADMKRQ